MLITSTSVEYVDASSRSELNRRLNDFIFEKNQEAVREMGIFNIINIQYTNDAPQDHTAMVTYSFTPSKEA